MNYFNYLVQVETRGTVLIYTIILFLSFISACFSQQTIKKDTSDETENKLIIIKFRKTWFFISFIILWFFYAFNKSGKDLHNYIGIFEESNIGIFSNTFIEVGYRLLNILIKCFVSNPYIAIGIIKTIILTLLYFILYKFRYKIHIGVAVLAFISLFYFQSFNLIRITLAGVLSLLSIYFVLKNKKLLCIICVILAITIHYTALVVLFSLGIYYIYKRMQHQTKNIWLIVIAIMVLALGNIVVNKLVLAIPVFSKYSVYLNDNINSGFGLGQYVFYIPIFICLYYAKKTENNNILVEISFLWTIEGVCIAVLGYSIGMLSRLSIYFCFTFVIFIPYFIHQIRIKKAINYNTRFPFAYDSILFLSVIYFIIRFILYISGALYADGIESFVLLWQ